MDTKIVHTYAFSGQVEITGLPPNRGMIVSLALFPVAGADAPAPYDGDPPTDEVEKDCIELLVDVDLDIEVHQSTRIIPFAVEHPAGHYYLQLRTVLFRKQGERFVGQAEQFFFGRRPLPLFENLSSVALPIEWPATEIEDMEHYGTFRPGRPRGTLT
jgi:hypothetical protein